MSMTDPFGKNPLCTMVHYGMVEVVATPLEEEVVTMVVLVIGTLMVALLTLTSPKVVEGSGVV